MCKVTFKTASGSEYRVNYLDRTVERLQGIGEPTPRVGKTARKFHTISHLQVGSTVLIQWGVHSATPAVDGAMPCTLTSAIVSMALDAQAIGDGHASVC